MTQRHELAEFVSLEHKAAADAECSLAAQCASLQARLEERGADLDTVRAAVDATRAEAASARSQLEACEAEVRLVHMCACRGFAWSVGTGRTG